MKTIESRLASLERGLRRWKLISCCLAIAAVGAYVLAAAPQPVPDVLRCHKLEVLDKNNKVKAEIWNHAEISPTNISLDLYGEGKGTGGCSVTLMADPSESSVGSYGGIACGTCLRTSKEGREELLFTEHGARAMTLPRPLP